MKKYKAIMYDIDGTIIDTLEKNMEPLIKIIHEQTGRQLTIQDVMPYASMPGMKVMEELGFQDKETIYARWVKYVNEYPLPSKFYPGIEDAIAILSAEFIQAVVSSKTRNQYEIEFGHIQLADNFATAVLYEDTISHKPDPMPLEECLNRLGIEPDQALYVGDAYSDYLAARAAGIDFGYATWGSWENLQLPDAAFVFEHPEDLCLLIRHDEMIIK